jgi:hypothetical protein
MVYSPQISEKAAATVKSFSYALGRPMTKALVRVIELLPLVVHPVLVCQKCQDKSRCAVCGFSNRVMPEDVKILLGPQA